MAENIEDDRFTHISRDPRFKRLPIKERKVKIDKRFKAIFDDDSFKIKYNVDKRGRPIQLTSQENLKKYYDLSDSDSSESLSHSESNIEFKKGKNDGEKCINKKKSGTKKSRAKLDNLSAERDESSDSSDDENSVKISKTIVDDESLDSNEDEDSEADEQFDHGWGELDANTERTDNISHRLAVCNMDWDRIKAVDLLVLFNSFKPSESIVNSVKIYLSDYGEEKLKEEELNGPKELCEPDDEYDTHSKEGKDYHTEKLRRYQLSRLKYYYAVVDCDSPETANKIYSDCDGTEYETSATKLDLRFIPDDVTFEQSDNETIDSYESDDVDLSEHEDDGVMLSDSWKRISDIFSDCRPNSLPEIVRNFSVVNPALNCNANNSVLDCFKKFITNDVIVLSCDRIARSAGPTPLEPTSVADRLPEAGSYAPLQFLNKALQQAKVELTWDETDPNRTKIIQNAFDKNDGAENDINAYLASSSDDDNEIDEQEEKVDDAVELDSKGKKEAYIAKYKALLLGIEKDEKKKKDGDIEMEVSWEPGLKSAAEQEINKKSKSDSSTPWGKYLDKRKEKQVNKRKTKDVSEDKDTSTSDQPFSDDDIPSDIDLNDSYFKEEFEKSSDNKKKKKSKSVTVENSNNDKSTAELELLLMDETSDGKHFNMKNIIENESKKNKKKKRKRKANEITADTDKFQVDVRDSRFDALYTSHDYNIDPSDQSFKRTNAMEELIKEKQRRIETTDGREQVSQSSNILKNDNLSSLVKSVKNKTNRFLKKKINK
ncbi:ESF1 [Nymphon striatum]|nr:ESF1 [Nymphon striatum]